MRRVLILMLILMLMLSSCGVFKKIIREDMLELAQSHSKNAEALKQVSEELRGSWEFYSGVLAGFDDLLTKDTTELIDKIDSLYKTGEWNDHVSGEALALRARLIKELGQQLVREALPGFLDIF